MKAISIKQPWASLIVHGIKPIENRTWKCPEKYIGQRVFVHASAKNAGEYEYLLNDNQKNSVMAYGWTHPLESVTQFYQESAAMHHCVFSNGYYRRPDCLILSAKDANGKRLETYTGIPSREKTLIMKVFLL